MFLDADDTGAAADRAQRASNVAETRSPSEPPVAMPTEAPQKSGLKLKIKFSGATKKIQVVTDGLAEGRQAELESLGFSKGKWLVSAPDGWLQLRKSEHWQPLHKPTEQQGPRHEPQHKAATATTSTDPRAEGELHQETDGNAFQGNGMVPDKVTEAQPANYLVATKQPETSVNMQSEIQAASKQSVEAEPQQPAKAPPTGLGSLKEALAEKRAAALKAVVGAEAVQNNLEASAEAVKQPYAELVASLSHLPKAGKRLTEEAASAAQQLKTHDFMKPEASTEICRGKGSEKVREITDVNAAKASSSSSSSSNDSSSSDSEDEVPRAKKRRRSSTSLRSRSREPGEQSDSDREEPAEKRQKQEEPRRRDCSPTQRRDIERERERERNRRDEDRRHSGSPFERSHRYSRDHNDRRHERESDRKRAYERDRGYDRHRERQRDRDYDRERKSEYERRHRQRGDYDRSDRDLRRRSSGTPEARDGGRSRGATRDRSPRCRSPRAPSRLGDPLKAVRSHDAKDRCDKPERRSRSIELAAGPPSRPPTRENKRVGASENEPQPSDQCFNFTDAWNMLFGLANEDMGSEVDIERLQVEATRAKHNVDSLTKENGGKYTLPNLVTLMRDSYLKYMKLCAIWEALLRGANAPPSRTRAKLADEGGVLPCTIALIRAVSNDARMVSPSSDATRLLRILAEKLVAIMQMRLVQVQRGKLQQDRQMLLACRGAPTQIDSYGRQLPGATDVPGETFQRPSPTDSNASNSTGELSVNPAQARPAARAPLPPSKPHQAGRLLPKNPANGKVNLNATVQGKVVKPAKGGRTFQKSQQGTPTREEAVKGAAGKQPPRMPAPNGQGREDAWAVEPAAWEIPPHKFEHITRSWGLLGGIAAYTGQLKAHHEEISDLMRSRSAIAREAAAMLGFLDIGLGMASMPLVLQLSHNVLELVTKIATGNGQPTPSSQCKGQ